LRIEENRGSPAARGVFQRRSFAKASCTIERKDRKMLKKLVWKLLAKATNMDFQKEYQMATELNCQSFLKNLLFHAYNNVPYYHYIFRKSCLIKNGKLCLVNFGKIPILTKEIIRERAGKLVSRDYEKRRWFYNTSGGSTGARAPDH